MNSGFKKLKEKISGSKIITMGADKWKKRLVDWSTDRLDRLISGQTDG